MDKNKPMMFIDTISSNNINSNNQKYFDSRSNLNETKWVTNKQQITIEKKIDSIINLLDKGLKVNTYIELEDTYIEGVIKSKTDRLLLLESLKEIELSKIKDIIILDLE